MTITRSAVVVSVLIAPAARAAVLDDLATVRDRTSHRASSYDRTGGNTDNVTSFAPGTTVTLLDTDGPGRITHVWLTVSTFAGHATMLRDLVLRMVWDDAPVPSVEAPLGDFFALGHNQPYRIRSIPIAVGDNPLAMNCYWPMPFHRHASVTLTNEGMRSIRRIYYNIDYERGDLPPNQALFHAEFRRDPNLPSQHGNNTTGEDNYVILDAEGRGQYVGCALFVDAKPGGWWGEGDEMIFIDDAESPTIIGTGSEDYFCNAWGYKNAFTYPFYGCPLLENKPDGGKRTSVYRWHLPDPVRFRKHIRVTIEHYFSGNVRNDYSSIAFWYQTEPVTSRPPLPETYRDVNPPHVFLPRPDAPEGEVDGTMLEPDLRARGVDARSITAGGGEGYRHGGYLRIDPPAKPIELHIAADDNAAWRVAVKPVNHLIERPFKVGLKGSEMITISKADVGHERSVPYVDLGVTKPEHGRIVIILDAEGPVGLDVIRFTRAKPESE